MVKKSATLSDNRSYRYELFRKDLLCRRHPDFGRTLMFIMLNPSTADESTDDATIRRCVIYAIDWGYNNLVVCNLSPYRATNPRDLMAVGPEPTEVWGRNLVVVTNNALKADTVVAAWGINGNEENRAARMTSALTANGVDFWCLGLSKHDCPYHPLMRPKDAVLVPYRAFTDSKKRPTCGSIHRTDHIVKIRHA